MRTKSKWVGLLSILVITSAYTCVAATSHGPTDALISALIKIESGGNDQAIGDKKLVDKAYGPLQIRKPCVDDINRRFKTSYRAEDCLGNRELSVKLFRLYTEVWGTERRLGRVPTDEDYARIWNGGPNGYKAKSTVTYWAKAEKAKTTFIPHGIPPMLAFK